MNLKTFTNFLLLVFLNFSCGSQFLNIADEPVLLVHADKSEKRLLRKLKKNYGNSKIKTELCINDSTKIIDDLRSGKLDVFIGSIQVPKTLKEDLRSVPLARDALLVVTNANNEINNLGFDELKEIFSKRARNWKNFTSSTRPIVVVDRKTEDIEYQTLYRKLFNTLPANSTKNLVVSSEEETLAALNKFPNAISYINFSDYKSSLKTININSIPASVENIKEGYFPLTREIKLYYSSEHIQTTGKEASLDKLLKFMSSTKGQELIKDSKLINLSEADLQLIKDKNEPIYIGLAAPLEGAYTELGKSIINAAKLAVGELNEKKFIKGKKLELVICNDKAEVEQALQCANKFVSLKVAGVIGHLKSKLSIEASKIYVQNQIPMITPASTHPWVTERPGAKGYVFRTIGRDDMQARLIANKIESLPLNHPLEVSIFHNSTVYGSTLSNLIDTQIKNLASDKVNSIKGLKQEQHQYHKEIAAMDADVLVFVGEYGDAAQLVKELALNNKQEVVFIGADGVFSQKFIDEAGLRAEGSYVSANVFDTESEKMQSFLENFESEFKQQPSAFSMNSYDATMILANAIKASNTHKSKLVAASLRDTRYPGITGLIYFNDKGDPVQARMTVYQVIDGKFQ